MPKLKIPEKIDMATEVDSCVVLLIISDCMEMLKAVLAMPHKINSEMMAVLLKDMGNSSSMQIMRNDRMMVVKR